MGKSLALRRVDGAALERLLRAPHEARWFLTGEAARRGWLRRWLGRRERRADWAPPRADETIELGEAGPAIHFLVTGGAGQAAGPKGLLFARLRLLGKGKAAPWCLLPNEVARVAEALAPLTAEELRARYRPAPRGAGAAGFEDPGFEDIWERFARLRLFLAVAAAGRQGVILWMR